MHTVCVSVRTPASLLLIQTLCDAHSFTIKVRGSGLFIGMEFVKAGTKNPDAATCQHVVNTIKENGILTSFDGPDQNVLRIKPPMCFSTANAKQLLAALDMALTMTRMNAEIVTPEFDDHPLESSVATTKSQAQQVPQSPEPLPEASQSSQASP